MITSVLSKMLRFCPVAISTPEFALEGMTVVAVSTPSPGLEGMTAIAISFLERHLEGMTVTLRPSTRSGGNRNEILGVTATCVWECLAAGEATRENREV